MNLLFPVEKLRSVGPRNIPRLRKLGIQTLKDLLWHFPVRYDDYTQTVSVSDIEPGEKVNIQGQVLKISSRRLFPRRMTITNAIVQDSTGAVKVVWFNQPYIENQLSEGTFVSLAGKANLDKYGLYLSSPIYEKIHNSGLKHTSGLVPIYPETEGITSKYLRFLIKPLLSRLKASEPLPQHIVDKHDFPTLCDALQVIHFPATRSEAAVAKNRFAFEDLLLFQLKALLERRKINQLKSTPIKFDQAMIKNFVANLPFQLTKDQKVAAWEIFKDLEKSYPMNRLLEGDVGSGKTVVALMAAIQAAKSGNQTVFLAPTEVLAQQHYRTITSLISNSQFSISNETPNQKSQITTGLLTASESRFNNERIKKSELKKEIAYGSINIIIGTHAVIQKDIFFKNLSLVVVDEQHRFGIQQRAALIKNTKLVPHLLSMTATPIPRTLALSIYGDLDISLIKEKPKNRQKIITKVIAPPERDRAYVFVQKEVSKGRQVFVVCPRIELDDPKKKIKGKDRQNKMNILWEDVKAVEEEYKKLSKEIFPDLKIAMLHGKLKPSDKNSIMNKFKDKKYDILVSTSVIEVGVDVPNATIMMIESAERFGLAQLHQFRGRVGRDIHQSYCLLLTSTPDIGINKRLKALVDCDDGFELAEQDMAIRGPGEFFGVKQSGMPDLGMASLANMDLIKKARADARLLLKDDPNLNKYPALKDRLTTFQKLTHFE
jgi:ATP-dependent DNA helicase RecG